MKLAKYETETVLLSKAMEAVGKTFGEIDKTGRMLKSTKGQLGHVIEESLFEYPINSDAKPDFEELGIELKVTPVRINKNKTLSAKERLVLNIIDYMKEPFLTFDTSSFWAKNQKILMMFYQWLPEIERKDYKVIKSILYTYPEKDLEIIKDDWEKIILKIKAGKAHELSEGDTLYLGACTKGADSKSLRDQPFSEIRAKQRAFSLKQSYMTAIERKFISGKEFESITTADELKSKTLEQILNDKFEPFIGKSLEEIAETLGMIIRPANKSEVPRIVKRILGIQGKGTKLDKIEEFSKANIEFKTIRLEPDGLPMQSMSFEHVDFNGWLNEEWEDSVLYKRFSETKFLFSIFEYKEPYKKGLERVLYLKGIKLWNMPISTIENEIKGLWDNVREIVTQGVVLSDVKRGNKIIQTNNLPKIGFNGVAHIRPKGKNGKDKVALPDGQLITKQCYWLNREYVGEILK